MAVTNKSVGGAFVPRDSYDRTGSTESNLTLTTPTISGQVGAVVSGSGATVTLTAAQSGALCLFDRAAGIIFTLPKPQVGLSFEFFVKTTITSNNAKIITDSASTFLIGTVSSALEATTPGATAGPKNFSADGSTIVACTMNGTTTGGIIGSYLSLVCISSTLWMVTGLLEASGTIATPFATS